MPRRLKPPASLALITSLLTCALLIFSICILYGQTPPPAGNPPAGNPPAGSPPPATPQGAPQGSPPGSPQGAPQGNPQGPPTGNPQGNPPAGNPPGNPPPGENPLPMVNPMINAPVGPGGALIALPGSNQLTDYRIGQDTRSKPETRTGEQSLTLFGYNYFEPARQAIEARRAYLRRLLAGEANPLQTPLQPAQQPVATKEELDAVAALTDAQKADLLQRSQLNTLTPEEKVRYRALFAATPQGQTLAGTTASGTPAVSKTGVPGPPPVDAFQQVADPMMLLFQNVNASVPARYQINPSDSITLRFWSPTMEMREQTLVVDPQGGIVLPELGRVIVRGQTLAQAEAALRERLRRLYRNVEVSLSLKELRTIQITVGGNSYYPGTYTVPAIVSAINMIYATGGPTEAGTLRRVEIRRGGALVGTIDFYKFLLTGDQTTDLALQPGDVIYIPGHGPRAAVRGEVRQQAMYELTEGESLKDVLRYAGGVKPSGVNQRVQILTVQPGAARVLKDVDVTNLAATPPVPVYDGDTVEVFSVRNTLVNKVTIEGAVDQPGDYAITPNMTVADLVERARGLMSDAFPTLAHLFRVNPDNTLSLFEVNLEKALARDPASNLPLTRWDRLTVYTRQQVAFTGRREVTVRGAVQRPGIYPRGDNMRVKDLLLQAGGTLPEAYSERAVLLHQRPDGSYAYDYISLAQALQGDPRQNVLIQDRDVLAVYTTQEARFTPEHTVTIHGEVVAQGNYPRGEGMRLSDALMLAGGLKPAAGDRAVIAHARAEENEAPVEVSMRPDGVPSPDPLLQDGDLITIQGRGTYQERPYVVNVQGEVNRPGPVVLTSHTTRLSDVIALAGGLKSEAYPEGTDFYRNPTLLATTEQKKIASVINQLNDLLNQADYKRAAAKSDIERFKAIGSAARSQVPISIPGVTTGAEMAAAGAVAAPPSLFSRDLVSPPRVLSPSDIEPKGNVAVNLPSALRNPNGNDDIVMMDGDRITIPLKPTTIQVIGAVMQSRAVMYRPGAKLDYYVSEAGGLAPDAAGDRAIVIRLGGGLTPIKKVKSLQPGDVILIPTRVLAEKLTSRQNDIDSLFKNLTSSAVIILVAKKLLGL